LIYGRNRREKRKEKQHRHKYVHYDVDGVALWRIKTEKNVVPLNTDYYIVNEIATTGGG